MRHCRRWWGYADLDIWVSIYTEGVKLTVEFFNKWKQEQFLQRKPPCDFSWQFFCNQKENGKIIQISRKRTTSSWPLRVCESKSFHANLKVYRAVRKQPFGEGTFKLFPRKVYLDEDENIKLQTRDFLNRFLNFFGDPRIVERTLWTDLCTFVVPTCFLRAL